MTDHAPSPDCLPDDKGHVTVVEHLMIRDRASGAVVLHQRPHAAPPAPLPGDADGECGA